MKKEQEPFFNNKDYNKIKKNKSICASLIVSIALSTFAGTINLVNLWGNISPSTIEKAHKIVNEYTSSEYFINCKETAKEDACNSYLAGKIKMEELNNQLNYIDSNKFVLDSAKSIIGNKEYSKLTTNCKLLDNEKINKIVFSVQAGAIIGALTATATLTVNYIPGSKKKRKTTLTKLTEIQEENSNAENYVNTGKDNNVDLSKLTDEELENYYNQKKENYILNKDILD